MPRKAAARLPQALMALFLCAGLAACGGKTTHNPRPNAGIDGPPEDMGGGVTETTPAQQPSNPNRELTYEEVQLLLRNEVSAFNRLFETSLPLFAAGSRFCEGNIRPGLGFLHWNNEVYGPEYATEVTRIFGVDNKLSVRAVAPTSPAAKQGLEVGDVIKRVGPEPIPAGAAGAEAFLRGFDADIDDGVVVLEIQRGSQTVTGRIRATPVCNYGVDILPDSNALETTIFNDVLLVSLPMIGYAESDSELATILAYQMARDIQQRRRMRHAGRRGGTETNAMAEAELDQLALYIAARAGHDLNLTADFLERLSKDRAAMAPWAQSMSPDRVARINRIAQEIRARKAAGLPLIPRPGTLPVPGES
ncbi:MAG: hypothetical protein Alpg2KO_11370 [Alphaproteobacteria bacterium]